MPPVLALLLQAAAAAPSALPAIDFDLARYRAGFDTGFDRSACERGGGDAIVVCGRRGAGAYPLERMERIYGPRRLMADIGIAGNLRGNIHTEAVPMDRGAVSNRVMIGLRLPF